MTAKIHRRYPVSTNVWIPIMVDPLNYGHLLLKVAKISSSPTRFIMFAILLRSQFSFAVKKLLN